LAGAAKPAAAGTETMAKAARPPMMNFLICFLFSGRRHPPTLPGVPTGTCTPSQLHGVQVRHATSAHCCSGLSGGAHGGVPGPPHTAGSADAAPTPTQPPTMIEAATAPIISNRFNMSSPAFYRSCACKG
jgi:hypothetical protein